MKKRNVIIGVTIFFLTALSILILIKVEEKPDIYKEVILWNGQNKNIEDIRFLGRPVCVIWYKLWLNDDWVPYKGFTHGRDIGYFGRYLAEPEVKEPNPHLKTKNKLSLFYYRGVPARLRVVDVYFDLEDTTFVGPLGKSQMLGELLCKKEKSEFLFYAELSPPYDDDYIKRVKESQRYQQELVQKLKKEAEAKRKISESNESSLNEKK
jgi:hypothetical protein